MAHVRQGGLEVLEPRPLGCEGSGLGAGGCRTDLDGRGPGVPSRGRTASARPPRALQRYLRHRARSGGSVRRFGRSDGRCRQGRRRQFQPMRGLCIPTSADDEVDLTAPGASTCAPRERKGSEMQAQRWRGTCQYAVRARALWLGLWEALEGLRACDDTVVTDVMHRAKPGLRASGEPPGPTRGCGTSRPSGPTVPQREPASARLRARRSTLQSAAGEIGSVSGYAMRIRAQEISRTRHLGADRLVGGCRVRKGSMKHDRATSMAFRRER